jgi:hypothetical protein
LTVHEKKGSMLKVIGQKPCHHVQADIGDNVPFQLRCVDDRMSHSLYWRTGDLKKTLLEIELNDSDGSIVGVVLLLPGLIRPHIPELIFPTDRRDGFPMVSVHDWTQAVGDDPLTFEVFADQNRLLIKLSNAVAIASISSHNVAFGVCAAGSISRILVGDLRSESLHRLVTEFN